MTAKGRAGQPCIEGCGRILKPRESKSGRCVPCYKRLVWRPRSGRTVDRDRQTSRDAKHRAAPASSRNLPREGDSQA
jgi:hypothetical protein